MEIQEKKESPSPLPVLPRLDRLDRLLQLLEEKNRVSEKLVIRKIEPEDQHITLSNALDEVHHKGTLMERLEMLEKRVLQLSLNVDEKSTSRSSSSNFPVSEKLVRSSGLSSVTKEDQDETSALVGSRDPLLIQEETSPQASIKSPENRPKSRKQKGKSGKIRRSWFRLGC
ncbi:Protein FAM50A like [Actinidia chinensis var. chinensis]|uniref:Protein FAM50A like n=1 Tax=Actinidia chinensis var. chinensis TaxID=1590841 RepID=A0A2R6Q1S7_ACTCC|nr:Protein FAM50A like [Actinidia chinensis var. chinensis]